MRASGPSGRLAEEEVDGRRYFTSDAGWATYATQDTFYWIVNLKARRLEVYTDPVGGARPTYQQRYDYPPGESVPLVLDGVTAGAVAVSDLLP